MVLDVVRVEKGRWQDDHILIIGHLATLKGDQMKNRNVQIPYELFFQLLQYFLMENYEGEEIIRKGLEKKLNAMVDRELYSKYKTAPTEDDDDMEAEKSVVLANNNYTQVASIILEGLGGKENVKSLENCITRLRLEIKDQSAVDEKKIKSAGIAGVIRPGKNSIQVIVGTKVQFVADEMKKMLK